jgi:hypothetical protein
MLKLLNDAGFVLFLVDYEAGDWPDTFGRLKPRPRARSTQSEPGTLKRFLVPQPQTEKALYSMSAIMASIGAGFDIRISPSAIIRSSIPSVPVVNRRKQWDSYSGRLHNTEYTAIRESFDKPESSFGIPPASSDHPLKSHTFHGPALRTRGSIDLATLSSESGPLDQCNGYRSADSLVSTTQSSDDIFGVTATPSLTSCTSSPFRSSGDNVIYDSSLSTSLDSEGIDCRGCKHHQSSAASSPALLESVPSVIHRSNHPRSLRRSRDSRRLRLGFRSETESATLRCNGTLGGPVRPTTLNINGHISNSPTGLNMNMAGGANGRKHRGGRGSQTPTQPSVNNDDGNLRSVTSPGSTPPHIDQPRTILDIDVDDIASALSCEHLQTDSPLLSSVQGPRTVSSIHGHYSSTCLPSAKGHKIPPLDERPPLAFVRTSSGKQSSSSRHNNPVSPSCESVTRLDLVS